MVVVRVKEHKGRHPRSLEESREDITKLLRQQQARKALAKSVETLKARAARASTCKRWRQVWRRIQKCRAGGSRCRLGGQHGTGRRVPPAATASRPGGAGFECWPAAIGGVRSRAGGAGQPDALAEGERKDAGATTGTANRVRAVRATAGQPAGQDQDCGLFRTGCERAGSERRAGRKVWVARLWRSAYSKLPTRATVLKPPSTYTISPVDARGQIGT